MAQRLESTWSTMAMPDPHGLRFIDQTQHSAAPSGQRALGLKCQRRSGRLLLLVLL